MKTTFYRPVLLSALVAAWLVVCGFAGWFIPAYSTSTGYSTPPISYHKLFHVDRPVFSKAELAWRANQCMVRVMVPDGFGSGVLFSRVDAGKRTVFVWTCRHVISQGPQPVTNKLSKGFVVTYREKFGPAKVLFKGHTNDTELVDVGSREMDISLLKVVGDFPECDSVKFLDGSPCIGDETLTEGYILNFLGPPTTTFGFFTTANQRVSPTETVDQLQLPVYPGHSGAGVYIVTGECIGLAEARMSDGLGFTVSSERIYEWARLHHIEWALDNSKPLP